MKAGSGQHFEQCYNAQAAVDEAMLIVGACVSVAANDKKELPSTVAAISPVVASQVKAILVDSGFYSDAAVQAVEQNSAGAPTGITVFAALEKSDHHKAVADLLPQPEPPAPGPQATPKEKINRLKTTLGKILQTAKQPVERLRHYQGGDGLSALQLEGPRKSLAGVDPGLRDYNLKRLLPSKTSQPRRKIAFRNLLRLKRRAGCPEVDPNWILVRPTPSQNRLLGLTHGYA